MAIILVQDHGELATDPKLADFESRHRVFVGLGLAVHVPFAMALIDITPILFATLSDKSDYGSVSLLSDVITLFAATYMIVVLFSGAAAIVFGVPFVLLCRRLGWEYWWNFAAGGALFGVPTAMVFDYYFLRDSGVILQGITFQDLLLSRAAALGALCGFLSGLTFWYTAYYRAPDGARGGP